MGCCESCTWVGEVKIDMSGQSNDCLRVCNIKMKIFLPGQKWGTILRMYELQGCSINWFNFFSWDHRQTISLAVADIFWSISTRCRWGHMGTYMVHVQLHVIDLNMCEPHYVNLIFVNSSTVHMFELFDIWYLFENLTSFWQFNTWPYNLNCLSPSQGYFYVKFRSISGIQNDCPFLLIDEGSRYLFVCKDMHMMIISQGYNFCK